MDAHRLVVVRHAKSAWPGDVPDVERPLNPRGRRDAPAVGRWIRDRVGPLDAVVCSPATRTRQTWRLAAAELPDAPAPVVDDRVYAATAEELLDVVREHPGAERSLLLVGHNPGVSDLVQTLTGEYVEMKTSAVAVLGVGCEWAELDLGRATLVEHATPRGT
jgi:phosphohistidine phosphatase